MGLTTVEFTEPQRQALTVIAGGGSRRLAAKTVGRSCETLYDWRRDVEGFAQAMDEADLAAGRSPRPPHSKRTDQLYNRAAVFLRARIDVDLSGDWYSHRDDPSREVYCSDCAVRFGGEHLPDCRRRGASNPST